MALRTIAIVCVPYLLSTQAAQSGLFGPSNFDECVLERLKGVTGDEATRLIARACAKKFPKTLPADFDERFGDYSSISGHVYERGGLSNPIRMEGARVRLLKPAAVSAVLKDHARAREKFYERAISEQLEKDIADNLDFLAEDRKKKRADVEFSEHRLGLLKAERKPLEAESLAVKQQANDTLKTAEARLAASDAKAKQADAAAAGKRSELGGRLEKVELALEANRKAFADAQAVADKALEAKKKKSREILTRKKVAVGALREELEKTRKQIEKAAEAKISAARQRSRQLERDIEQATRDLDAAMKAKASALRDAYVKGSIHIKNYALSGSYRNQHCFSITNKGKLAIRSLTLGMRFNGQPSDRLGVDIDRITSTDTGLWLYNRPRSTKSYSTLIDQPITPMIKNKYDEPVHGIGPGQTWPRPRQNEGCLSFDKSSLRGDVQRAFEKVGGFHDTGWIFYLKSVDLARHDALRRTKTSYAWEKTWTYLAQGASEIFKHELEAARPNLEPHKRRNRLQSQREAAAKTIRSLERERATKLGNFDRENTPLLTQMQAQETEAEKSLHGIKRELVGGEATQALIKEKSYIESEISELDAQENLRKTERDKVQSRLKEESETWQSRIALAAKKLEFKAQEIEAEEKKITELRGKLEQTDSAIADIKSRSGKVYGELVEWARKNVMSNRDKDRAWLDQLLQILDNAEGQDVRVDLNGAYEFRKVPYGDYLVYVNHKYRRNRLLWLTPVEVKGEKKLELGPFNSIVDPHDKVDEVVKSVGAVTEPR